MRSMPFEVTFDKDFYKVIAKCAEAVPDRENTWINEGIEYLYGHHRLLDTQFITDHLKTMGAIEVSRDDYHRRLSEALDIKASFHLAPNP